MGGESLPELLHDPNYLFKVELTRVAGRENVSNCFRAIEEDEVLRECQVEIKWTIYGGVFRPLGYCLNIAEQD
jgi:hypothetical protein